MSFVPIDDDITFIRSQSRGKFPYSNALLIQDERTVLIDTGVEPALIKRISKKYSVDFVINSHCHSLIGHTLTSSYSFRGAGCFLVWGA